MRTTGYITQTLKISHDPQSSATGILSPSGTVFTVACLWSRPFCTHCKPLKQSGSKLITQWTWWSSLQWSAIVRRVSPVIRLSSPLPTYSPSRLSERRWINVIWVSEKPTSELYDLNLPCIEFHEIKMRKIKSDKAACAIVTTTKWNNCDCCRASANEEGWPGASY